MVEHSRGWKGNGEYIEMYFASVGKHDMWLISRKAYTSFDTHLSQLPRLNKSILFTRCDCSSTLTNTISISIRTIKNHHQIPSGYQTKPRTNQPFPSPLIIKKSIADAVREHDWYIKFTICRGCTLYPRVVLFPHTEHHKGEQPGSSHYKASQKLLISTGRHPLRFHR